MLDDEWHPETSEEAQARRAAYRRPDPTRRIVASERCYGGLIVDLGDGIIAEWVGSSGAIGDVIARLKVLEPADKAGQMVRRWWSAGAGVTVLDGYRRP